MFGARATASACALSALLVGSLAGPSAEALVSKEVESKERWTPLAKRQDLEEGQVPAKPDDFIEKLDIANEFWASRQSRRKMKEHEKGQAPSALVLGCSDSRVIPEFFMDKGIGEIFVTRNVGNVVDIGDMSFLAVLQYAVEALGVKDIAVIGHYKCGGVKAALEGMTGPDPLARWITPIIDVKEEYESELVGDKEAQWKRLVELNAQEGARRVSESKVVQKAWENAKDLKVHALVYDIATGRVDPLSSFSGRPVTKVTSDEEDEESTAEDTTDEDEDSTTEVTPEQELNEIDSGDLQSVPEDEEPEAVLRSQEVPDLLENEVEPVETTRKTKPSKGKIPRKQRTQKPSQQFFGQTTFGRRFRQPPPPPPRNFRPNFFFDMI